MIIQKSYLLTVALGSLWVSVYFGCKAIWLEHHLSTRALVVSCILCCTNLFLGFFNFYLAELFFKDYVNLSYLVLFLAIFTVVEFLLKKINVKN